jgi:subtilase family serine protease
MRNRRRGLRRAPLFDDLDDRCLLSGFSPYQPAGYTPSQIASAYGLSGIMFKSSSGATVKGDGSGETIALIEMYHDPNIQSDLNTFDAKYGLPNTTITVVNQAGSQTDSGWALEESLDVEWAHAIAPGANILVVEAAPSNFQSQALQNLLNAVNTARNTAGVVAISMSWGFNEMPNESSYDSYFTTPAGHTGITFIASSGDSGVVEYPSASPDVLSVGGTSLYLSSSGAYASETAWSDGGGGYSLFEGEPSYQASVQTSGARSTPDVAFDADPNTGVEVYSTDPRSGQGSWQVLGGTSVGAPSWAGIIAIADQGRAAMGVGSLDGPSQTLPALYAAPSSNFHSALSNSSFPTLGGFPFGGFSPWGGFYSSYGGGFQFEWGFGSTTISSSGETANTVTGLGTPIGGSIVADLATSTLTTPVTPIGGSGSGSGSGTAPANPPTPTQPTQPVGGSKHHGHKVVHKKTHVTVTNPHKVVKQAHPAAKKVTKIRIT